MPTGEGRGGGAGGETAGREQPYRPFAPRLAEDGGGDARRLAGARWRYDNGVGPQRQRRDNVGKDRVDRKRRALRGHRRLNKRGRPRRRRLRSAAPWPGSRGSRTEEHTSEIQSLMRNSYA